MNHLQIAIDGPAGAGKSTIARKLAKNLNITYVDTGAMYRALTYKILKDKIEINNIDSIIETAKNTNILLIEDELYLDNQHITDEIRSKEVTHYVSYIAQIPELRKILVELQKKIADNNSVVMDGRDIGTFVLPNANVKIFLTASIEERAYRRYNELLLKDQPVNLQEIKKSIEERDKIDSQRDYAPLVKAEDAIELDTTGLSIDEVIEKIIHIIHRDK
ncbi:cytidylate kinase [Natronincola peptidivorans]|uniref:Cytidylate kinase n=1 Tax=Natronincola peptidivorans TaxID=426128 RepID=A0A1H9YKA1_9FIRM|nr:(d)CMP kinase [Natronincola peptidivorans]SES69386.1 cytidylate kinase [Natronincola peptidivorans]